MPQIKIENLIIEKFDDVLFDILDHKHTHYSFPGGRGSTKSSFIGIVIPLLITQHSGVHAVIFKKYANTLRDFVYAQIISGITMLGMQNLFKYTVSPMEIIYKPTGQKIMFRGFDEPEKIKSIKVPFGYIGISWYEELDQFPGRDGIRKAMQSTMRGGELFWNFESFNPPITASNWANEDLSKDRPDRLITWSNYNDVPREWLGEQFIEEAEFLKSVNERAYRHEYLGEAVGTGGMVFENIVERTITDDEISRFDRHYYGNDWGWYPDPNHFVGMNYHAGSRTLYVFKEVRCWKTSNLAYAELLSDYKNVRVISDTASEGQKSIADMNTYGFSFEGARKGPGSVEAGMKWLQSLNKIVIDPARCPYTTKELLNYEYERAKDGSIISGYPDRDNHGLDCIRYATEEIWRVSGA